MKELDLLKDDANVYKMIGPVLVKQDLAEARANVRKRIEYISAELYIFLKKIPCFSLVLKFRLFLYFFLECIKVI